jgi:hypothetical protein
MTSPAQRGWRGLRSKPRFFEPEELLPDVTARIGKPVRFTSAADRHAYEKLWARLAWEAQRRAA